MDANVAKLSKVVEATVDEDDGEDHEIPLPNVKSAVLAKVIEYCEHYPTEEMTPITTPLKSSKLEDLVQPFYADYVKVDTTVLFELVTAANFMDIQPLVDLTCLAVSIAIKGRTAEELRALFNLSTDFSPDEEAAVREENKWAEQPPPSTS